MDVIGYYDFGGQVELPRGHMLPTDIVLEAVESANEKLAQAYELTPTFYALLGMRNLSAFVGAVVASELERVSGDTLVLNPHQDGYPDLLLLDELGRKTYETLAQRLREKGPFSPFPAGGLEIKATCGDTRSAAWFAARGGSKPGIHDERIDHLMGLNWKAHHRDTNNLMGLVWDFVDGLPTITVVTYRSDLSPLDWGNIVIPEVGGGRTTSVSIMTRSGVRKMFSNVVLVIDDDRWVQLVERLRN